MSVLQVTCRSCGQPVLEHAPCPRCNEATLRQPRAVADPPRKDSEKKGSCVMFGLPGRCPCCGKVSFSVARETRPTLTKSLTG